MEKQVEQVFTQAIIDGALIGFGLTQEGWKQLGDFENYVYLARRDEQEVILRFTHSSHRSPLEVESELDWMNHLVREGVAVMGPLAAKDGRYVLPLTAEDGTVFSAALFEKAEGRHVRYQDPNEWNTALFEEWGRLTGQIHRATLSYEKPEHLPSRPHWDDDELLEHARDYVQTGDEFVLDRLSALLSYFQSRPRSKDSYGLLHTDMHSGNFFVDGGRIHLFDFDDCSYTWFVHDLAIPLYYSVSWGLPEAYEGDANRFAADFFQAFWEGYRREYALDPAWLQDMEAMLKLRDLTLYLVIYKKVSPEELTEDQHLGRLIKDIRCRLQQDVPIVTLSCPDIVAP
ncbi:phosphotransferase [Gorillibacterium sp. CAU 1737]|uniref:phosphotransferase enzyme family protein n=1 Tax=Gorillibacterium sp. CAU 1737 TaxID=3140362 RepID=UPI003260D336